MLAQERRKEIVRILMARKSETRENLAFEFGVSVRTISYDIEALSSDYPIYTLQGGAGGIYIDKRYKEHQKYLSCGQARVLEKLLTKVSGDDAIVLRSILKDFGNKMG